MVGKRFQDGAGAVGAVFDKNGQGFPQRFDPVVVVAGMAVDTVEECRNLDELVARVDELEIQQIFLARHGENVRWDRLQVNREGVEISACG